MGDVIDMNLEHRRAVGEAIIRDRVEQAAWERETKHPKYLAMIDAAIARAKKPWLR